MLFQTQLYRRIEEALKHAAKELKNTITETDTNLKFILKEAGVESAAELARQRETVTAEWEEKRTALGRIGSHRERRTGKSQRRKANGREDPGTERSRDGAPGPGETDA